MSETSIVTKEKIENFKGEIFTKYSKELENYFGKNEKEMLKFMSGVVYSIQKVPMLLNCDRQSLITAVLELAQLGIAPSITGESYILPYKNKATAMIGYQGFVGLLYKAGINSIYAEIVRENDVFENILGSEPKLIHKVDHKLSHEKRGEAVGCYVSVKVGNETIYKYMHKDDILKFRKYSQSYNGKSQKYSPWFEENDPELNMWKKTVLKQMMKYLPKNEKIAIAVEVDNKEADILQPTETVIGGKEDLNKVGEIFDSLESNNEENE